MGVVEKRALFGTGETNEWIEVYIYFLYILTRLW